MPPFGTVKRKNLTRYLQKAGFDGLFSGGKHQCMIRDENTIRIPNPHQNDIGKELLQRILRQADISRETWETL